MGREVDIRDMVGTRHCIVHAGAAQKLAVTVKYSVFHSRLADPELLHLVSGILRHASPILCQMHRLFGGVFIETGRGLQSGHEFIGGLHIAEIQIVVTQGGGMFGIAVGRAAIGDHQ